MAERRRAQRQADALIMLVRFIKEQIEYYRMPLDTILLRCEQDILCRFGQGRTLAETFENTRWQDRALETVALELSRELGRGYFSEQLCICERALAHLNDFKKTCADTETKRAKTEGVLSIGGAVLAVILFI
jgi:hypothetical protein